MKKSLIAVGLLAAFAISSMASAKNGSVEFTGSISDLACTVDTNSLNQSVDMGKISKTAFAGAGTTAAAKQFTLVLKNCPEAVRKAVVRFDGTQVPGNDAVLALKDEADKAQNIGIQISDKNNNVVSLYQDSSPYDLAQNVDNKLNFVARYYALAEQVTAGSANAVTNFTIVYQ